MLRQALDVRPSRAGIEARIDQAHHGEDASDAGPVTPHPLSSFSRRLVASFSSKVSPPHRGGGVYRFSAFPELSVVRLDRQRWSRTAAGLLVMLLAITAIQPPGSKRAAMKGSRTGARWLPLLPVLSVLASLLACCIIRLSSFPARGPCMRSVIGLTANLSSRLVSAPRRERRTPYSGRTFGSPNAPPGRIQLPPTPRSGARRTLRLSSFLRHAACLP